MDDQTFKNEEQQQKALDVAKDTSRKYAKVLWGILAKYSGFESLGETSPSPARSVEKHRFKNRKLLKALSVTPYLLATTFIFSFYWDFNGIEWEVLGYVFQIEGLIKILSVSGLIGFLTNWLAITMLFKPSQKRPILGHGLIPAQKDRIAFRLAQAVSEDLINPEIIKEKIHQSQVISKYREETARYLKDIIDDPSFRSELKIWVVNYVDDMIADPEIRGAIAEKIIRNIEEALQDKSIERVALRAYSFIKGQEMQHIIEEALIKLPSSVESGLEKLDTLLDRLPSTLDEHSDDIEQIVTTLLYKLINQLDVRALVEDNLKSYDEQHLSRIIRGATNEQLRYIQYLGAILGIIGGFVIWEPLLSLVMLAIITALLLSLDQLLLSFPRETS